MKQSQLIMLSILCSASISIVKAQYLPNGGFEEWEMKVLYEEPESWNTGNLESFRYDIQTASMTEDSYSGDYALRIESVEINSDTLFGYVTSNGTITDGDAAMLEYTGGIPISAIPDSLFGYFKYDLATDDTALVLVSFKLNGSVIGQDMFPIVGDQSSYTKLGWEIGTLAEIPDTVFIAITSTNPFNSQPGNWLQADSLWFGAISDSILNCDFEVWEDEAYFDPENHATANVLVHLFGGDTSATRITDAHSGDYAISIKAVETKFLDYDGFIDIVASFLTSYHSGEINFNEIPTFPIDFNPVQLTGYYKFMPVLNDSAIVVVRLVDDQDNVYEIPHLLLAEDEYTPFTVDLIYPPTAKITEIGYIFSTTIYFGIGDGGSGEVGSELILDDLELINPCDLIDWVAIDVTPPSSCDNNVNLLDAGDEWDEYLWSTDETTQTITVEDGTFSVTVTHFSGCEYDDEVTVSTLSCPDTCDLMNYAGIIVQEPTCDANFSVLDAGDDWDEYQWSTYETTQTIQAENGVFSVTVTDNSTGCEFSDEVAVSKIICDNIHSATTKKVTTAIFPNPSEGEFVVELENYPQGEYYIEIISITGKSLIRHTIQSTSENHKIRFNLSRYPQGLYMVKIEGNDYSHYERIRIE